MKKQLNFEKDQEEFPSIWDRLYNDSSIRKAELELIEEEKKKYIQKAKDKECTFRPSINGNRSVAQNQGLIERFEEWEKQRKQTVTQI